MEERAGERGSELHGVVHQLLLGAASAQRETLLYFRMFCEHSVHFFKDLPVFRCVGTEFCKLETRAERAPACSRSRPVQRCILPHIFFLQQLLYNQLQSEVPRVGYCARSAAPGLGARVSSPPALVFGHVRLCSSQSVVLEAAVL